MVAILLVVMELVSQWFDVSGFWALCLPLLCELGAESVDMLP